jgi:O-Antigen ligase
LRAVSPIEAGSRFSLIFGLLAFPMFVAAWGSLPRRIDLGSMTGMGALTIVEVGAVVAGLLMCGRYPKWLLLRTLPYLCLLVWAGVSTLWGMPGKDGVQNALVYTLFGGMVLFSGTMAARDPGRVDRLIDRGLTWISWIALGFVFGELALRGLPTDAEESWWIGPRPVAILGVVVLSRYLARWYYGDKHARVWIGLWTTAIVLTISRAATATSLILIGMIVLAQMRFQRRRVALTLPVALGAVALVVTLVLIWSPFYQRMFTGDAVQVAGTAINVAGRARMWELVIESAKLHPWVGQGLGSAQVAVGLALAHTPGQMTQPHNDYLRIWHDLGVVGLGLFLAAVLSWTWILARDWYAAERRWRQPALLEMTGLLVLIGLSVVEITDNAVVYQAVMGTAGTLVGAGLGARAYRHKVEHQAPMDPARGGHRHPTPTPVNIASARRGKV